MAKRKRDYYAVLGVSREVTEDELKRVYRELARKHHPDMSTPSSGDGGERFREINEAYAVLSDRESRGRYDRWGHPDESSGFSAVVDAAQQMINDVLRGRKSKQKGKDIRYTLELTFEEAAFGASKTISLPDARSYTVVISAGTKDGTIRSEKGEGEPGKHGGSHGDLHVLIRVAEHPTFKRDGFDVHSTRAVTFSQAALGAIVEVDTLDGAVKMRIPEGTQPGAVFRIRGRGVPHAAGKNATRGDHLVDVQVTVPTQLTPRERELIEELARAGEGGGELAVPAKKPRLLDRVRSLLDE